MRCQTDEPLQQTRYDISHPTTAIRKRSMSLQSVCLSVSVLDGCTRHWLTSNNRYESFNHISSHLIFITFLCDNSLYLSCASDFTLHLHISMYYSLHVQSSLLVLLLPAVMIGCLVADVKDVSELAPLLFVPQLLFAGSTSLTYTLTLSLSLLSLYLFI